MDTIIVTSPDDELEGSFPEEMDTKLEGFRNRLTTIEGAVPLSEIGVLNTDVNSMLHERLI